MKILPVVKEIWSWHESRLKLVTFNWLPWLEPARLSCGFCTLSHWGKHLTSLMIILPGVKKIWSRHKIKAQTCDLQLGSWIGMVESWVQHIVSLRQTFDQCLMKILPGLMEIWSGQEIQGSNLWPSIVTLSRHGWVMGSAHRLTEGNIWPNFNENSSRGKGDMERTKNLRLQLMTLTLSQHGWVTDSAHRLTERNIWPKPHENLSKGSGEMELTRKCYRLKDGWMDRQTDEGQSSFHFVGEEGGLKMTLWFMHQGNCASTQFYQSTLVAKILYSS